VSLELVGFFVTSFVVGLSGALMPGPLLTLAIAETAKGGFRRGPTVVLGHAVVEALAVVGLLLGVGQVFGFPLVSGGVGVVGGLVLVWMGYGMGRSAWRGEVSLDLQGEGTLAAVAVARDGRGASAPPRTSLLASPVVRGGAVSIANPFWLLWWATIGAAYVGRSLSLGPAGPAAFFLGHISADLGWTCIVSAVVASGRRALHAGVYRGVILLCAIALAILGAYFLLSGAPQLAAGLSIRSAE
jgi:threonine/homoserine/homoserine lactone efflux protein